MPNNPAVSIITIVYNGLPYLKECVQSVVDQSFQDWELLISDDGSKDGSREFLKELTDPRITVFFQDKNLGIFDNLNFLFSLAKAPVSQILCQDDYFTSPGSLQTIISYWKQVGPSIGYVRFNHSFPEGKGMVALQSDVVPAVVTPTESSVWFYLFGNIPGNLSNVSVRTNLVLSNGGFDQRLPFAGDFEFWVRLSQTTGLGISEQKVTYIRRHPGVASNYLNKKGELLAQIERIASVLYKKSVVLYPEAELPLKKMGIITYDVQSRDTGIKRFLRARDRSYLIALNKATCKASYNMNRGWKWWLYFVTIGGRTGMVRRTRSIIKKVGLLTRG